MSNVLITTLGKARPSGEYANAHGRYKTLRYKFDDEFVSDQTSFFGKALFDFLSNQGQCIDKIVILGTSGSMWDAWIEVDARGELFFQNEAFAHELQKAVDEDAVTDTQLLMLSEILSGYMSIPVSCRLVPYGKDMEEQLSILRMIAESGDDGDAIFMDVTHGLRHLPMLEMLSSFLMSTRLETKGFFYGAAELREGDAAPTIRLDGASRINEWICAISILKNTGSVTPLSNLPGMERLKEPLLKCQFYEQMNNVAAARKFAQRVIDSLDLLPDEGQLFRNDIERVFSWVNGSRYAERQFLQAEKAYKNGDCLRSVILFMETVITANIQEGDALNAEARRQVQETLNRGEDTEWHILRQLRNSLAHGGTPEGRYAKDVIAMRQDESRFESEMEKLIRWVRGRLPRRRLE